MFIKTTIGVVIFLSVSSGAYALNPASRADCDYVQARSQRCPSADQCPKIVAFLDQCAANFDDDDDDDDETANATPSRQSVPMPNASNDPILQQSDATRNMIENPGGMSMQQSFDLAQRCDQHDKQACVEFEAWKQRMKQQGQATDALTRQYERGAIAAGESARIARDGLRQQTERDAESSQGWATEYGKRAAQDTSPVDRHYDEQYHDDYTHKYEADRSWLNNH